MFGLLDSWQNALKQFAGSAAVFIQSHRIYAKCLYNFAKIKRFITFFQLNIIFHHTILLVITFPHKIERFGSNFIE